MQHDDSLIVKQCSRSARNQPFILPTGLVLLAACAPELQLQGRQMLQLVENSPSTAAPTGWLVIATDADTPSDQLEWSVTDRRFVLQDSPDGNGKLMAVRAGQQFDFEAEQNSAGILPVSVLVWDGSNVAVLSIPVQLTDINDHHPVFAKSTLTVELASSTAHQPLWQAQATDRDGTADRIEDRDGVGPGIWFYLTGTPALHAGQISGDMMVKKSGSSLTGLDISWSVTSVSESNGSTPLAAASLGRFAGADTDGGAVTWHLVGGLHHSHYEISGAELRLKAGQSVNYEAGNRHELAVELRGAGGDFLSRKFWIPVANQDESIPARIIETSILNFTDIRVDKGSFTTLTDHDILYYIADLMTGKSWAPLGTGRDLTYSFVKKGTNSVSVFASHYFDNPGPFHFNNAMALPQAYKTVFKSALSHFSDASLLNFAEITDSATQTGQLRGGLMWGRNHASVPGDHAGAGDIWLEAGDWFDGNAPSNAVLKTSLNTTPGDWLHFNMLHEIGHALGLAHSHEGYGSWDTNRDMGVVHNVLPWTVMSYAEYTGDDSRPDAVIANRAQMPQTLMMNDIAALKHLYGVNETVHSRDTAHTLASLSGGRDYIYATIHDASGQDSCSWADRSTMATIDMRPGAFSYFGHITHTSDADLGRNTAGGERAIEAGSGLLGIAYNTLIEKAFGGSGNDKIHGNLADNLLWGGPGGTDQLTGDAGNDVFAVKASDGSSPENADRIKDFEDGVDKIGLTGSLRFADLTLTANGSNTRITHSSGTLFEVENITPAQLSQEDFILLAEMV